MHELAITQNILNIALDEAGAAGAEKITRVNLVVGELSGVVADSVQFYFDLLKVSSAAEEAAIVFETVPAQLKCRICQTDFRPEDSSWICPDCHGSNVEVISGRDCYIESIEVE